jgi:hypothetical protein
MRALALALVMLVAVVVVAVELMVSPLAPLCNHRVEITLQHTHLRVDSRLHL